MRTPSQKKNRFFKSTPSPTTYCSLIFIALMLSLCFIGPYFSPYSYTTQHFQHINEAPSLKFLLGTDTLGRDLLTRLMYGGQISFAVGITATAVSLIIGVSFGLISAYCGGKIDAWMMRFVDCLYALPFTIFVILLTVIFGRHFVLLFVAIGAVEWLTMARIIRAEVLHLKTQAFFQSAELLGLSHSRLLIKHLLPNLWAPIIAYGTLTIPASMLLEATLSFLGLGIQPPMSSWGVLIHDGVNIMQTCPWTLIFPTLFFSLTLLALNFIGDYLRKNTEIT
jgi:oligopeptide transport system permease protein